jgi:hypothetical protein
MELIQKTGKLGGEGKLKCVLNAGGGEGWVSGFSYSLHGRCKAGESTILLDYSATPDCVLAFGLRFAIISAVPRHDTVQSQIPSTPVGN